MDPERIDRYSIPAMSRVLILFAHPAIHRSRANRVLADAVRALPGVTFHDLYAKYPHHLVDVSAEQALLQAHDAIVWQHPFYWYSAPSLLKEWQDVVLEHGFAYGEKGTALRGKRLLSVVTTGGPQMAYRDEGYNRYTMRQFLAPFDQTAHLCGMQYLEPLIVHGVRDLNDGGLESAAAHYRNQIVALCEGKPLAPFVGTPGGVA
jgi:glutathione-regulated potassium-efflux system ancillary protein KefG